MEQLDSNEAKEFVSSLSNLKQKENVFVLITKLKEANKNKCGISEFLIENYSKDYICGDNLCGNYFNSLLKQEIIDRVISIGKNLQEKDREEKNIFSFITIEFSI